MENNNTAINPIEDQRAEALRHYNEASKAINFWSGFVEAAIKAYNPKSCLPEDLEERIRKIVKAGHQHDYDKMDKLVPIFNEEEVIENITLLIQKIK